MAHLFQLVDELEEGFEVGGEGHDREEGLEEEAGGERGKIDVFSADGG